METQRCWRLSPKLHTSGTTPATCLGKPKHLVSTNPYLIFLQGLVQLPSTPGSLPSFSLTESRIKPNILQLITYVFLIPTQTHKLIPPLLFLAVLCGMQDLSSLTRDQTLAPALGATSLNHWTAREVPRYLLFARSCAGHCGKGEKSIRCPQGHEGPVWEALLSPQPNSEVERIILTHSFSNCLLSPYCVPGNVIGDRDKNL